MKIDLDWCIEHQVSPNEMALMQVIGARGNNAPKLVSLCRLTAEHFDILEAKGFIVRVNPGYTIESFVLSNPMKKLLNIAEVDRFKEFYDTYPVKEGNVYLRNEQSKCRAKYNKALDNGLDHDKVMAILKAYIAHKEVNDQLYAQTKNQAYWMPRHCQMSVFINNIEDKITQYEPLIGTSPTVKVFGGSLK